MRIKDIVKGANNGYCRICGKFAKLTVDHIPPKKCGNQMSVNIYCDGKNYISQNGLKAKTICENCNNNKLGATYDKELIKLYTELSSLENYLKLYPKYYKIKVDVNYVVKSLIGHLLAVIFHHKKTVQHVLSTPLSDEGIFSIYRDYFMDVIDEIPNVDIIYWYYPYKEIIIMPYFSFVPDTNVGFYPIFGTMIKFYPIAIFLYNKKSSKSSFKFNRLDLQKNEIIFNLKENVPKKWPEMPSSSGLVLFSNKSKISTNNKY